MCRNGSVSCASARSRCCAPSVRTSVGARARLVSCFPPSLSLLSTRPARPLLSVHICRQCSVLCCFLWPSVCSVEVACLLAESTSRSAVSSVVALFLLWGLSVVFCLILRALACVARVRVLYFGVCKVVSFDKLSGQRIADVNHSG